MTGRTGYNVREGSAMIAERIAAPMSHAEVIQLGRGCYAVYVNDEEYTRFGTYADAVRFARELNAIFHARYAGR